MRRRRVSIDDGVTDPVQVEVIAELRDDVDIEYRRMLNASLSVAIANIPVILGVYLATGIIGGFSSGGQIDWEAWIEALGYLAGYLPDAMELSSFCVAVTTMMSALFLATGLNRSPAMHSPSEAARRRMLDRLVDRASVLLGMLFCVLASVAFWGGMAKVAAGLVLIFLAVLLFFLSGMTDVPRDHWVSARSMEVHSLNRLRKKQRLREGTFPKSAKLVQTGRSPWRAWVATILALSCALGSAGLVTHEAFRLSIGPLDFDHYLKLLIVASFLWACMLLLSVPAVMLLDLVNGFGARVVRDKFRTWLDIAIFGAATLLCMIFVLELGQTLGIAWAVAFLAPILVILSTPLVCYRATWWQAWGLDVLNKEISRADSNTKRFASYAEIEGMQEGSSSKRNGKDSAKRGRGAAPLQGPRMRYAWSRKRRG